MTTPEKIIRPDVQAMLAYKVDDATGMTKLDVMELPYALPDDLKQKIAQTTLNVLVNRYPDPRAPDLKQALRQTMNIPDGAEILVGNGSDECLQTIITAVAQTNATLVMPVPGFPVFKMSAGFNRMKFVGVPHLPDLTLDLPAVLEAIEREQPALVVLIYPNNPTGTLYPRDAVERIIAAAPGLVVIDEAYRPYAKQSFMADVLKYPNLIVMSTLSKLGFAGLRVGFAVGGAAWIEQFDKVRPVFNLSNLTQAVAVTLLEHMPVFQMQTERVLAERERMMPLLKQLPGLTVFPSAANFILVRVAAQPGSTYVNDQLKARKILIKSFHGTHPLMEHCLRLTVGTPQENTILLQALEQILKAS